MRWFWSDRRVLAPGLVLAAAALVHAVAIVLALRPAVDEAYAARYITLTSRCLRVPPPPVVTSLPARLVPFDGQLCPALLPAGWYPPEPDLAWSSATRATIALTLGEGVSVRRLTLYFPRMLGAGQDPRTLQVMLNGAPVTAPRISNEAPFEVLIPGEQLTPGATHRIELRLKRLFRPVELGSGKDQRRLGVALAAIILE